MITPPSYLVKVAQALLLHEMREQGVSFVDLARKLRSTAPHLRRILNGAEITAGTAGSIAYALGCEFKVDLKLKDDRPVTSLPGGSKGDGKEAT